MANGEIKAPALFKITGTQANMTVASGSFNGTSSFYEVTYDESGYVSFVGMMRLQSLAANARPAITITDSRLVDVPSFWALGSPILRGNGSTNVCSDSCYASHTKGQNTITVGHHWYFGTAPAGYASYEFPNTRIT